MSDYVFTCSRYPQLQVGPRPAGVRFHDGRFETDDPEQAASLRALSGTYGVECTSAPPDPRGAGEGSGSGPDDTQRPARSASKADWLAYARAQAADSDEEAALDDLTKEQLIEQYGGSDDG